MKNRLMTLGLCMLGVLGIGTHPRMIEEVRVGGGYGDTSDGGLDIDGQGHLSTDGVVHADGGITADMLGVPSDADLLVLAPGALTVRGSLGVRDALGLSAHQKNYIGYLTLRNPSATEHDGDAFLYVSPKRAAGSNGDQAVILLGACSEVTGGASEVRIEVPGTYTTVFAVDAVTGHTRMAGDLLVDGGDLGLTADPDLLGLAGGVLSIRGTCLCTSGVGANGGLWSVGLDTNALPASGTDSVAAFYDADEDWGGLFAGDLSAWLSSGSGRQALRLIANTIALGDPQETTTTTAYGNVLLTGTLGIPTDTDLAELSTGLLTLNGNLIVAGHDIGLASDPDVVQLLENQLRVNSGLLVGTPDMVRGSITIAGDGLYAGGYVTLGNSAGNDDETDAWLLKAGTVDDGDLCIHSSHGGGFDETLRIDAQTYDVSINEGLGVGGDLAVAGAFLPKQVDDESMDATPGLEGEIVYNQHDHRFYGCTAGGSPATWSALN
ncbi:MAG TPA: hypothetical protein PLO37_12180 [Candidatus Hydrogenedentes bacterium]|nr:hypothetical protein [Candidatus Hydrogenedentota bacterium]HPG67600.1 hypothetical protein [Candidatus Hydrogenedentota bacterium]